MVNRRGDVYFITDKGTKVLEELMPIYKDIQALHSGLSRVIDIFTLRPLWVYMYLLPIDVALPTSVIVLAISIALSYMAGVRLMGIFSYINPLTPWYETPLSLAIYFLASYLVHTRLRPYVVFTRWLNYTMLSVIPIALSLSIASMFYMAMPSIYGGYAVFLMLVNYLAPLLSITSLSTWTALESGISFESITVVYLLILYIPSSIAYLMAMGIRVIP